MIFTAAGREEIIPANPARNIDKPVVPGSDSPVKHWEPVYLVEFFDRCGRRRLGPLFELTA